MKKDGVGPAISVFRNKLESFIYKRLCRENVILIKYQHEDDFQRNHLVL
jgi:hypothetical protein